MISIGIDISKYYHIVHFKMDDDKNKFLKIENNREGFNKLLNELNLLDKDNMVIGMESTGHYWKSIALDLEKNGYKIQLVNAHHVKKYKEIDDNTPNKNDYKDSRIISQLIANKKGLHANIYNDRGIYSEIKSAFDCRYRIVEDLKRDKLLIRTLIERYFPEYESIFKSGIWIKSSINLLLNYGFCGLTEDNLNDIDSLLIKISKGHIKRGVAKKIINLFKSTIGLKEGLVEANFELQYRMDRLVKSQEQLDNITKRLETYLEKTEEWKYLKSVPGIGIVFGSGLLAELGDISKYNRSSALTKMAGLNLTCNESGTIKGKYSISRRGRSKLRHIAYMIALNLVKHDKNVNKYYKNKISKGKPPVSILVKISDKALRMVHNLVNNKCYYDSNKFYNLD